MKNFYIISLLFLTACTSTPHSYQHYLASKGLQNHQSAKFEHCRGYGCKFIDEITLNAADWREIEAAFNPSAENAEQERGQLKKAIALFEHKTGELAGTAHDKRGTFLKLGGFQHDCVDESTNTTVYLSLLKERGLLRYHNIEPPSVRLPLIHSGRWPHQTAVITEIETSKFFAVDSWFHDNGHPPEIVPLKDWKEGFKPDIAT